MKDRLGAGALFTQPPPSGQAATRRSIADGAVSYEVDVGAWFVGGPMCTEIVKKDVPVREDEVLLEVSDRKRERVVDPNDGGSPLRQ